MPANIQKRYLIQGKVQGVSFRYFTQMAAQKLGVAGSVRNLPDGRVEAVAVAEPETLAIFEHELHKGPPLGKVTKIDISEEPLQNFTGFEILR